MGISFDAWMLSTKETSVSTKIMWRSTSKVSDTMCEDTGGVRTFYCVCAKTQVHSTVTGAGW